MSSNFIADPTRDATAVIRGFVYQVDITIRRWLALGDDETLELERGEDLDIVARGLAGGEDEQRITEQVKSLEANLTLRSKDAVQAVANFALHRQRNPTVRLFFRFTTTARVGVEQQVEFPASLPGIVAWERLRTRAVGETEEEEISASLRGFYRSLPRPTRMADDAWAALQNMLGSAEPEWIQFLSSFEWSLGSDEPARLPLSLQQELIAFGLAPARTAEEAYRRLFVCVFRLLATDGEKRLSRADLLETLAQQAEETAYAQIAPLLDRMIAIERRIRSTEKRLSTVEETHHQLTSAFGAVVSAAAANAHMPPVDLVPIATVTEAPPLPAHLISRSTVVQEFRQSVAAGWLAISGDTGSGKTQLAHLIARAVPTRFLWLRFTDLSPGLAATALRRTLEAATQLSATASRQELLDCVFERVRVNVMVLDDLPRIDSRSPLFDDVVALARSAAASGALIVSTSLHVLPASTAERLGNDFGEVAAPSLSDEEVEDFLAANGAQREQARALAPFVRTLGEGHAGLIAGIALYMQRQGWSMTAENLLRLLRREHAGLTRREVLARLLTTVVDAQTRELLYRMMLAVGELKFNEVRGLSETPPPIDAPRERLSQLEGLWVQVDSDDRIRVPPVVRLLEPELSPEVRRFCYAHLAFARMRRGALSPLDVMKVITYFMSAGLHYEAGLAAAQGFMELEHLGPIPDAGLSEWFMWPLPDAMPDGIKLFVRGTQLGMRLKWKKEVSFILADIDEIFDHASNAFERSCIIIAAGKLLTGDPAYGWRALPLFRRAMAAHDEALRENLPSVPISDEMSAETIFVAASSVADEVGFRELQLTVEMLTEPRRVVLDRHNDIEDMFLSIPNNMFIATYREPQSTQNWPAFTDLMARVATWALHVGWPLLHAHATRMNIVALGEHMDDLDGAVHHGMRSLAETEDERSKGIIEAAIGKQLNLKDHWSDAREWYASALSRPATRIAQLHYNALIEAANAEQDFSLPSSIAYLRRAVALADSSEELDAENELSARAELAISLLLNGDNDESLAIWDEAGRMLLEREPPDDVANGRTLMFLRHAAYFYFSAAGLLPLMECLPPKRQPDPPKIGQFHAELRAFGSGLDSFWRGRILVLLGRMAEARGDAATAIVYGGRAIEVLSGLLDAPTSIIEESKRLAALPDISTEQP
jgi:tetratricopeptide (TPR) repeat protein